MAIMGRLLKNKRAGEERVAWHRLNLVGPDTLDLRSDAFAHNGTIPLPCLGERVGGRNVSPGLAWNPAPSGTAELVLVIEDVDTPMDHPIVHALALVAPELTSLPAGALHAETPADGVRLLRSSLTPGYLGPTPPRGHGPHRYAFQLFALARPLGPSVAGRDAVKAKPHLVLEAISGPAVARGRLDGFAEH